MHHKTEKIKKKTKQKAIAARHGSDAFNKQNVRTLGESGN